MKKLLIILFGYCYTIITLASQPPYDQLPITPQAWEEVDLTYTNIINGREYTEPAKLLRPHTWIKQNHLDKVGTTVHLTKEQLGIDVDVKVIAIKLTKLNYSNINHGNNKPVIATFITHSIDVGEYIFKDQYGHKEVIHVASGHLVYSADRQAFIPIEQFRVGEHSYGNKSILISKHKQNKLVKQVYNFEVYEKHRYFIGNSLSILVHNILHCCPNCNYTTKRKVDFTRHERTHTGAKPYECSIAGCKYAAATRSSVIVHERTHTGEKPYECSIAGCKYAATTRSSVITHELTHTGEKPYECSIAGCKYAATTRNSVITHERTHTGERPYGCSVAGCTYAATTSSNLTRHRGRRHPDIDAGIPGANAVLEDHLGGAGVMVDEEIDMVNFTPPQPPPMPPRKAGDGVTPWSPWRPWEKQD